MSGREQGQWCWTKWVWLEKKTLGIYEVILHLPVHMRVTWFCDKERVHLYYANFWDVAAHTFT